MYIYIYMLLYIQLYVYITLYTNGMFMEFEQDLLIDGVTSG